MFFFLWESGRFVWKVPPKNLEGVLEGKLEDLPIILEGLPIIGRSSNILPVVLPYIYKAISPHNYKVTFPYIHAAIVPCILYPRGDFSRTHSVTISQGLKV